MKKIILAIIAIFSCLLFSGCASVDYARVVYGDGSMKDVYTITVNNINAPNAHNIYVRMKSDLSSYITQEKQYYISAVRDYFDGDEETKYVNGFDFYISEDVNGDTYTTVVTRTFASLDVYDVYGMVMTGTLGEPEEDSDDSGYILEDGFFFKEYATYSTNWFYSAMQDPTIRAEFEAAMDGTEYNFANFTAYLDVTQTYVCPTSKLHANCDETDTYLGYTLYQWDLTDKYDNDDGYLLKFYYNIPNATNWYILCACIAILVAVGLIIAIVVLRIVKKKRPKEILPESTEEVKLKKKFESDQDDGLE